MHDCGRSRSIGYFLEPLVCIALFAKKVRESAQSCYAHDWRKLDLQPCFAALALTQHALACYLAWHVLFGQSHLLLAFGLHVHAGLKITLSNASRFLCIIVAILQM